MRKSSPGAIEKVNRDKNLRKLFGLILVAIFIFCPLIYGEGQERKIDINSASERELMELPGIGQVIAKEIITYRERHNGFKSREELKKVKWLGEKRLKRIRELIVIGEDKEPKRSRRAVILGENARSL